MQIASHEPPIDFPIAELVQYKEFDRRKGILDNGFFETCKRRTNNILLVIKHIA